MAYPPPLPPATRTDSTISAVNHAADHNKIASALRDLVEIIGADPAGSYLSLTDRLLGVAVGEDQAAIDAFRDAIDSVVTARSGAEAARDEAALIALGDVDATLAAGVGTTATLVGAKLASMFERAFILTGVGIDLTGATDSTTALRARFAEGIAAGYKRFVGVPGATYRVAIPTGETLFTVTGLRGITIDLAGCTLDNSATSYTADVLTPMFLIDGAIDTTIRVGRYIGFTLPAPLSHLGYRGATLVLAINGAKGITVDATADNLRYGVQSGEYGDPSKGGCSGFRIKLRGTMVGYPIALYLADDVEHDVDVDGLHRAVYIAGVNSVRGTVRFRDQYIADTAYLITDVLTSGSDAAAQANPVTAATTSRGCSDVDVTVIDKGSTVLTPSSALAGITLSRVDPCVFRNIKVRVQTVGTDTVSTVMGGFRIVSGAKAVWNRYPYNWESHVVLDNITVSGVVDHSACTLPGNTGSEVYLYTYEAAGHGATVRNIALEGLTILPSSGQLRGTYIQGINLKNIVLDRFHTPGLTLELFTNTTAGDCTLTDSRVGQLNGYNSTLTLIRSEANGLDVATTARVIDSTIHGVRGVNGLFKHALLALDGATTAWANAIPQGATPKAVLTRVNTAITGATGYDVGVAAEAGRYGAFLAVAAGTTSGNRSWSATEATLARSYGATTDLVITARGPAFTGGVVRVVLIYELATNITS